MQVIGRDTTREVCLVRVEAAGRVIEGPVPEHLIAASPGPCHQNAYDWLAAHARGIAGALTARAKGCRPDAPYSDIALAEEF